MKAKEGIGGVVSLILNLTLDRGELSASCLNCMTSEKSPVLFEEEGGWAS